MIQVKRAYEPPDPTDGMRILVDRLWPRGLTKHDLSISDWIKEVGPSNELRRWFGHKPERWRSFLSKYFRELDEKEAEWQPILDKARRYHVTLIYGAKDTEHNNALALKEYLEQKLDNPTCRRAP